MVTVSHLVDRCIQLLTVSYWSGVFVSAWLSLEVATLQTVHAQHSSMQTNAAEPRELPDFDSLQSNYPRGTVKEVRAAIGGNVNRPENDNLCAIRVSHSLNLVGHLIPRSISGYLDNKEVNEFSVGGKAGLRYIYRVDAMIDYLSRTYGLPTFHKNFAVGDPKIVPVEIGGKQGILVFKVPFQDGPTGHVDLWNGTKCEKDCYFAVANELLFWECEDIPPAALMIEY